LNISLYIAKRYLRSPSSSNAINTINIIAGVGIVVGVAILFFVLSVFSGLIDFSLSFSNNIDPDLKIETSRGKSFSVSENQYQKIKKIEGVFQLSKIVEERVLFSYNNKDEVTFLKGVDSLFAQTTQIKKNVQDTSWLEPNTRQVIVGAGICDKLGLGIADVYNQLEVFVPKPGSGTIDNPDDAFNKANLVPVGVYSISEDYDYKYVFCDIALAQSLLAFAPNQITAIEIKLKPNANEQKTVSEITSILGENIIVKNKTQLNDALYKMLNTENVALYLIFTLVIIVFLFNLVGALIMMILEKQNNLKTLYNLGAEVSSLRKIFLFQGTLLCVLTSLIGLAIGIALVVVQQNFNFIMITDSMAYPVKFTVKNIFVVLVTVLPLGLLASLIASSRVSKKLLT
jgi:lipoprotein-releasing system permease protein